MKRHKRNIRTEKGFTLVELLVVIVIISLLSGVVGPMMYRQIDKSKWDLTKPKMKAIESALGAYYVNCGEYPASLDYLVTDPGVVGWAGPYLKVKDLIDPWGYEYDYVIQGSINPGAFDLISYGKDGAPGGNGYNAEQYND